MRDLGVYRPIIGEPLTVDRISGGDANIPDFDVLSALLVYREVAFAGGNRSTAGTPATQGVAISLAVLPERVRPRSFEVVFLSLSLERCTVG